jgi:hypothetical protein
MNNLSRFTSPASGANIKKLLKELNDKGAQLRSVLWLETRTTSTPVVDDGCHCTEQEDDDLCDFCLSVQDEPEPIGPCQLELSVGNNMVLTELFADQIDQILPFIKGWVINDLEAIEKKLNDQGVYLEGQKPAPILPGAPFEPVNIQFLSKAPAKGDLVVMLEDVFVLSPQPEARNVTLKKGTKHRVIMTETKLADSAVLVHIQPEDGLEIYRVNTLSIQPIQE